MTQLMQTRRPFSHLLARHTSRLTQALVGVLLCLAGGCSSLSNGVVLRKNGGPATTLSAYDQSNIPVQQSYSLSPFDQVSVQILPLTSRETGSLLQAFDTVRYQFTFLGDNYRILRGDELVLRFSGDPKLEIPFTVRPDGKITVSDAGEFSAVGKTTTQLASEIDAAFHQRMTKPGAVLTVAKSNLALAELAGETTVQPDGTVALPKLGTFTAVGHSAEQLAVTLAAASSKYFANSLSAQVERISLATKSDSLIGSEQTLVVSADGKLTLPQIGSVAATGKSVLTLESEIRTALNKLYPNPFTVTISIKSSANQVFYIDGEVRRPGVYPLTSKLTLARAMAIAGGAVETGDLRKVVLIHRDEHDDVTVYVTNLKVFFEQGLKLYDLPLTSQDIIVVPRSTIAKANLWVDQYITRLLPFSRNVSYSYNEGQTNIK